jgi:hypothetical protein
MVLALVRVINTNDYEKPSVCQPDFPACRNKIERGAPCMECDEKEVLLLAIPLIENLHDLLTFPAFSIEAF